MHLILLCIKVHENTPKLLSNLIGLYSGTIFMTYGIELPIWDAKYTLILSEYRMYGIRSHKQRSLNPKTCKKTFHSFEANHEVSIKHCFSRNNIMLNTSIFYYRPIKSSYLFGLTVALTNSNK